jgi:hypothetical protein
MEDGTLQIAARLLGRLADVVAAISGISTKLRQSDLHRSVSSGSSIERFRRKSELGEDLGEVPEFSVWIELITGNGASLSCVLEIVAYPNHWSVNRSVTENFSAGPRWIKEYDDRSVERFSDLDIELMPLTEELIVDFSDSLLGYT